MKDYYKILHVPVNASKEEVEESYKQLSEEYKPEEHYPEESYHVRYYKEIQEAFHVLSNSERRAAYTRELLANRDKVVDFEKRHREEGFGDVLKLLLNDPKAKNKTKKQPKRIAATPPPASTASERSFQSRPTPAPARSRRNYTTPVLILAGIMVIVAAVAYIYVTYEDTIKNITNNNLADSEAGAIESAESETSLLEENLYGAGEENYEEEEEASSEAPYTISESVSADVANLSLQDCFELLSDESTSFERKENAIARALQFFEGRNSNVKVIGSNNVQTRRETIEDYLFILMLQGYDVEIVNSLKNNQGKITEIAIQENL